MSCDAELHIADDYGDNIATMKCCLPIEHEGSHREEFSRQGKPVIVIWDTDEREKEAQ